MRGHARIISPTWLGVLAVVWAIGFMTLHGYQNRPPFAEEANIAVHVSLGHGFLSPMDASPTAPPSAWSAPAYPLVIAAAFSLFGLTPVAVTALMLVNALCFGLIVVGTDRLAVRLFGSQVPGLVAVGLLAIHPLFLFYMGDFWDGFLSLAMFVWLTAAAVRLSDEARSGTTIDHIAAATFGLGMGVLALTNSSYVAGYPILLYLAFRKQDFKRRWRSVAVACVACVIAIAPWTARNYQAFGRFIPLRTGSSIQFWVGNAPGSDGWLDAKAFAVHPYFNRVENQSLLALGEPAYNDLVFTRFKDGVVADPGRYVVSCLRRALYLIVGKPTAPSDNPLLFNWTWHGIFWDSLALNTVLAILGMVGMVVGRRFRTSAWEMPVLAAGVALPFVATAVSDRYSLPLRWLLVLYAGAAIWALFRPRSLTSDILSR